MAAGGYVSTLYLSDAKREAMARVDEYLQIRPTDAALLRAKLLMTLISGDPDEALRLLDRPDAVAPYLGGPLGRTALGEVALAKRSGSPTDRAKAVVAVVAAAHARQLNRPDGVRLLAALGAVDDALTMAETYAADPRTTQVANFSSSRVSCSPPTWASFGAVRASWAWPSGWASWPTGAGTPPGPTSAKLSRSRYVIGSNVAVSAAGAVFKVRFPHSGHPASPLSVCMPMTAPGAFRSLEGEADPRSGAQIGSLT